MSDNKKGNTVLLTVIAIATLLVAIVGATFAYFTASVQGNETASSVVVTTASLGTITYQNGTELVLENAYPGAYSNEITFTVASEDNTIVLPYEIKWVNISNNFVDKTDLVYTLNGTASNGGTLVTAAQSETVVPSAATTIGAGSLAVGGDTHTYTMRVHFKETAADQNSNQGRTFVGKIEVSTGGTDSLYYNDLNKSGTSSRPTSAY